MVEANSASRSVVLTRGSASNFFVRTRPRHGRITPSTKKISQMSQGIRESEHFPPVSRKSRKVPRSGLVSDYPVMRPSASLKEKAVDLFTDRLGSDECS